MRLKLSPKLIRSALGGHSLLGLTGAALLYVLAVSGTFCVFYPAFERWEEPQAYEMEAVAPAAVARATRDALSASDTPVSFLTIVLPTEELPRMIVAVGDDMHYAGPDGSLLGHARFDWTEFLIRLHLSLNLPDPVGPPFVGLLGILVVALILSGLLSHPTLFRDAFALRIDGSGRQRFVDLHNRLGVWASPFHLVLALTGAFLGLWSVFVLVISGTFYDGHRPSVVEPVLGAEVQSGGSIAPLADIEQALLNLEATQPEKQPAYVLVHAPETSSQVVEIGARVPRRLAWAELYSFDPAGQLTGSVGWADGAAGTQVYGALHRIHFGNYGGLPVRIVYVLLGLALCLVVASGTNIWLSKRRLRGQPAPRLERAWTAVIWGVPFAVAMSALVELVSGVLPAAVFWSLAFALPIAAAATGQRTTWSRGLRLGACAAAIGVVAAHAVSFPGKAFAPVSMAVTLVWLFFALLLLLSVFIERQVTARSGLVDVPQ